MRYWYRCCTKTSIPVKICAGRSQKVELFYKAIEKHFLAKLPGEEDAIITDTKKVVHTLNALCIEMDNQRPFKEAGCRNIREYNEKNLLHVN